MPSRKERERKKSRPDRKSRPILWVGGSGLPGGAVGKNLMDLGYPLHWEPASPKAARSVAAIAPALVVIDQETLDGSLRNLLGALSELKPTVDLVVFQLRSREPRTIPEKLDGVLLRGPGLVQQLRLVLSAIEGARPFKAAGARAVKRLRSAQAEVERLRTLAVKDDLTSLYNLRFFNRSLETEHQRATRFGRSYSLIFLDLDGLREVNTRDGHMAGAQVLKHVGEFLNQRIRRIDLPARIGGDEFVVICPETEKDAVRLVADRLRHGIQRLQDEQGKPLGITASIGIASFPEDGDMPEEILQRADRALYEAKALGKNRVCCWGDFVIGPDDRGFHSVHGHTGSEPVSGTLLALKREERTPSDDES